MTDVLLISPPYRGLLREPLGLYYLAGVLKSNDVSVSIFDFNLELPSRTDFHEYMDRLKPRIVGVTSYTFNFSAAKEIINEVKIVDPSIVSVMGGVHASALPEDVLHGVPSIDYVIVGEGELTFLEVCQRILNGGTLEGVQGVAQRVETGVIVSPPRDLISDLDELPIPDRQLLPFNRYPLALVQTSRGCPYSCIFCLINRFYGRNTRQRDAVSVADECEGLVKRFNAEKFFFFGDSFTFNPDWVEEFCDEIIRRRLKIIWGCETRVDNVSLPMLKKMRRAGCIEVQYWIDYGDESVLKNLGKNITLECVSDAVNWAKEAELFTGGFFIFNVPGEDEDTIENTFNLIQRVPLDAIEVNLLTPYPGTPIWEEPERYGMRITDTNYDNYTTKKYVMENLSFPSKRFIPVFKTLLKRLNFVVTPNYRPEIFDFLKDAERLQVWKKQH
jgi:radical SAM superfamily enzyme YgiQ (UPF0313 family)